MNVLAANFIMKFLVFLMSKLGKNGINEPIIELNIFINMQMKGPNCQ